MRKLLIFLFLGFSNKIFSQVPMALPPEADAFYNKAMPVIKSKLKKIIVEEAKQLKNRRPNEDSLFKTLHTNPACKGINERDLRGITMLIMVQVSKDADEDLKNTVISMRNTEPVATKASGAPELSNDEKTLKLQMIAQQKSDIAEQVSFVMEKLSDNSDAIINNLK